METTLILLGLLSLLFAGVPVAISLGLVSTIGIWITMGPAALYNIGQTAYSTPANFVLIAVPLFILLAEVLSASELSSDLFDAASKWLNWTPGGLASGSVLACAIFGALTGSSAANTAAMGNVCVPEMLKRGYDKGLATGSVCAAGALAILIPPSIMMIIYGSLTDNSIAKLFMAGLLPGVLLAIMHVIDISVRCKLNPKLAPPSPPVSWKDRWSATRKIWWVGTLIVVMMGGIYSGICTPTEAAALGSIAAIVLSFTLGKRMTWVKLESALSRTVTITCMVLFILVGAMLFGYFVTNLGIPQGIVEWITSLDISRWWVLIAINILYVFLGCILDAGSIFMITVPILYPVVMALHFDPIWFGVIIVMNMEIGNITPPFGINLFVMKGIVPRDVLFGDIIRGITPFVLVQALALVLTIAFPWLSLWLPSTMK